jgi:glycopeptide antibiotics resistance protein
LIWCRAKPCATGEKIFMDNKQVKTDRLHLLREKYLPYNERTLNKLIKISAIMFMWIIIWSLVFKLGSEILILRNYSNLKDMTFIDRIMWDLIPFNYRGDDYWKMRQFIETILNCFVFAPLGIMLCYMFKKINVWRNALICLGCSVCVELLQLFTVLGNPSTEDLITNTLGCFIGYAIYNLWLKRLSIKGSVRIFMVASTVLAVLVIFSMVTMAISFDVIVKVITKTL